MTLNPVFRSEESVNFLIEQGYMDKLKPALEIQEQARKEISDLVLNHYGPELHGNYKSNKVGDIFQQDFFLIFFIELCRNEVSRFVDWYAKLNYLIRARIAAADNLFDSEDKTTLPFKNKEPKLRFLLEYGALGEIFPYLAQEIELELEVQNTISREIMRKMAYIGRLEGSEEEGIDLDGIPEPKQMIRYVHRVRGGALFELGMIAPPIIENGQNKAGYWKIIAQALNDIGTAFQIMDDIVDFEFDLKRRSNNLVFAEIYHNGKTEEAAHLRALFNKGATEEDLIEKYFLKYAERTINHAYEIARHGFEKLQNVRFWYKPEHTEQFVNAVVEDKAMKRIKSISE